MVCLAARDIVRRLPRRASVSHPGSFDLVQSPLNHSDGWWRIEGMLKIRNNDVCLGHIRVPGGQTRRRAGSRFDY